MLDPRIRDRFDDLLDHEVAALPPHIAQVLEEVPLIVEDEPSETLLAEMGMSPGEADLCGLHEATPITERGVEDTGMLPGRMMLFRGPIVRLAGYRVIGGVEVNASQLHRQIHITLLHEIGHHFGLDEDDLAEVGYD
ncbi:MAG: metallopeptidase family protein [Phycisphaerales bacterium JB063]